MPLPQTHEKVCNYYGIVAGSSVKYVPSDGFFGIQILQNSISAGALPRTPLGSLRRSQDPKPLVSWGGGYPLHIPHPIDAFGVSL